MKKEKALEEQIKKKILEMESPDYRFPKRFSKKDYILVASVAAGCLLLLVLGAFITA